MRAVEFAAMSQDIDSYRYRGARALVLLHERSQRSFLACWHRARSANLALPETDDPAYRSLETLLRHVLVAAASYMEWMCESLGLPDPGFRPPPALEAMADEADAHVEHLLAIWRLPLADVTEVQADAVERPSRWGVTYGIDAMLEHAAIHPMRHQFQLEELLERAAST